MIRAATRSLGDLDKARLCWGKGITYPADLSGRGAKTGRAGWVAGEVKGSFLGLGVLLPGKPSCHWTGAPRLLWALRISPSCMYVALGKCLTWPSSKVSLWDLWPLFHTPDFWRGAASVNHVLPRHWCWEPKNRRAYLHLLDKIFLHQVC